MLPAFSLIIFIFLTKSSGNVSARHVVTTSDESEPSRPLILVMNSNGNLLRSGDDGDSPKTKRHYIEERQKEKQKQLLNKFQFLTKSSGNVSPRHVVTTSDESEPSRPLILVINSNGNLLRSGDDGDSPKTKRHYIDERQKEKQRQLLEQQQRRKRAELMEFMKDRYLSTNYFYDEMKRIIMDGRVKDSLRRMATYMERPGNEMVKRRVLKCYIRHRSKFTNPSPAIDYPVNNLVINNVKDPFNDGVH